jgi:hypothetical protein
VVLALENDFRNCVVPMKVPLEVVTLQAESHVDFEPVHMLASEDQGSRLSSPDLDVPEGKTVSKY